jgi:C4-type Zn-finger protein
MALTKAWNNTDDLVGHEPNFQIDCVHCQSTMFLRTSRIYFQRTSMSYEGPINSLGYKCEECGYIQRFEVVDTEENLLEIVNRRKGSTFYVPDMGEWAKESERRKQRLEALGYC